jgi:hypothetical protein
MAIFLRRLSDILSPRNIYVASCSFFQATSAREMDTLSSALFV